MNTTYTKLLDMHTHTDNSFDGNHSTMFLCEQAEARGLRAIAFTDHVEMDRYYQDRFDRTAKQSLFEIRKAASAFRGKLLVLAGIEIAQPAYEPALSNELLACMQYDIVVASVHNLRGMEDFWFLDYSQYDVHRLLDEYFEEMILMAQWGNFDTLAHLTYPLRYIMGESNIPVELSRYQEQIDTILRTIAQKNIALEINTSGLRQKLGVTMPDEPIVRRFRELGGKYVTIGSDAHYAKDIAAGIPAGMDLALRCGFSSCTLYQKREPMQIPIA